MMMAAKTGAINHAFDTVDGVASNFCADCARVEPYYANWFEVNWWVLRSCFGVDSVIVIVMCDDEVILLFEDFPFNIFITIHGEQNKQTKKCDESVDGYLVRAWSINSSHPRLQFSSGNDANETRTSTKYFCSLIDTSNRWMWQGGGT